MPPWIAYDYIPANTPPFINLVLHPLPHSTNPTAPPRRRRGNRSPIQHLTHWPDKWKQRQTFYHTSNGTYGTCGVNWCHTLAFGLCYSSSAWLVVQILSAAHVWRQSLHESLKTPLLWHEKTCHARGSCQLAAPFWQLLFMIHWVHCRADTRDMTFFIMSQPDRLSKRRANHQMKSR